MPSAPKSKDMVDDTTRLDTKPEVQAPPDEPAAIVKPDVKIDAMTTDVTIHVSAIQEVPGNMCVITTTAGQLIVPGVAFSNEQLPADITAENSNEDTHVVVKASYARSQGLV